MPLVQCLLWLDHRTAAQVYTNCFLWMSRSHVQEGLFSRLLGALHKFCTPVKPQTNVTLLKMQSCLPLETLRPSKIVFKLLNFWEGIWEKMAPHDLWAACCPGLLKVSTQQHWLYLCLIDSQLILYKSVYMNPDLESDRGIALTRYVYTSSCPKYRQCNMQDIGVLFTVCSSRRISAKWVDVDPTIYRG